LIVRIERVLTWALTVIGLVLIANYLLVALIHLHTLYDINQTSGAWLSFAYYARSGVFYPPLSDNGFFGGTRYMPLFFSLHALLGTVTGELLTSGKLLTLLCTLAILAALAAITKRKVENAYLALAIPGVLLATFTGHQAGLTIRGDVLPLALSTWALAIGCAGEDRERRPAVVSAVLAGLAPLAKFTSLHALTAMSIARFHRDRRRGVAYAAIGLGVIAAGLAITQAISHGGLSDNLASMVGAPTINKRSLPEAIGAYFYWVKSDRALALILVPAMIHFVRGGLSIDPFRIYFLLQLLISVGFYFDSGAEYNHLIDLAAAGLILAASSLSDPRPALRLTALACLLAGAIYGLAVNQRDAWTSPERAIDPVRMISVEMGLVGSHFLSQDPTVAVLMQQRPIVADDFQFRVMVFKGIIPEDALAGRIRAGEFDRIILLNGPEPNPEEPSFVNRELGERAALAIREIYVLEKRVDKYYIYRPRPNASP
jgi:hypothetical protein